MWVLGLIWYIYFIKISDLILVRFWHKFQFRHLEICHPELCHHCNQHYLQNLRTMSSGLVSSPPANLNFFVFDLLVVSLNLIDLSVYVLQLYRECLRRAKYIGSQVSSFIPSINVLFCSIEVKLWFIFTFF